MDKKRLKRPELKRDEPKRGFSTLFEAQSERPNGQQSQRVPSSESPDSKATPSVADGVSMGYRVIDAYLRQGQEMARSMGLPWQTPNDAAVTALTGQMMRYSAEMATVWMELVQNMTRGARPPAETKTTGGFDFGPEQPPPGTQPPNGRAEPTAVPASALGPVVWVEVHSKQPIEVCVRLEASASGRRLVVHDLRAADPQVPRLRGIVAETLGAGEVRVRIHIADDQPPGVYSGIVVDEATNLPAGTVSVRLSSTRS